MENNKIQILDPILSKMSKPLIRQIGTCLEYDTSYYRPGIKTFTNKEGKKQRVKEKHEYRGSMIDRRSGSFLTGFIPKLKAFAKRKKIELEIDDREIPYLEPECEPYLEGITFRPDQLRQIKTATDDQRGVIKAPTGSGKTILTMGFLSQYKKLNTLLLCHSVDILNQTRDEMIKFGFKNVSVVHGKSDDKITKGINLVTIQTYSKFKKLEYADFFDIVIVDEAHHVISLTSQYGKVLQELLCPIRIGFTATLPEGVSKLFSLEGLLGPVIDEVTIQEGVEEKMLAQPYVTLIPVKLDPKLVEVKKYQEIYKACITYNKSRNRSIIKKVLANIKKGKTSLILVKEIAHGHELMEIALQFKQYEGKFIFLQGASETSIRNEAKKNLNNKEISAVIATAVWREGISINTLDCIVNASGGRSEVQVIQIAGRALRASKGKEFVEIVDFLDPYRYLAEHAIRRIGIYLESGWL